MRPSDGIIETCVGLPVLARVRSPAAQCAAYTRSMAEGAGATRVLVVDDEANLAELVQGYLERDGYDVVTAADGPTAVALAREAEPDLIVLDLMLPGFDGLEVCRRVRAFSDAYILMLTARAEE